ncbi:hypothetical protein [Sorangium cellulosum]|uniref:hypothetical protein n=1 Tax=Sorangium cellulosum TaxID=56 RepID=UPI000406AC1A|nr:hypothetical protein [Sorangium cellulosum]
MLSLIDDEGRVGLGEATPLPGFSPDSADDVERALAELPGALGAIDLPGGDAATAAAAPAVRRAQAPPTGRTLPACSAPRCA